MGDAFSVPFILSWFFSNINPYYILSVTQQWRTQQPVQKSKPTKELSVRMVGSGLWIYKVPLFRCN